MADPDHSVFFDYYLSGDASLTAQAGSRIEGIGRPRVEPSFVRGVIDAMIKVPDNTTLAALRYLETRLGRKCGGSTGTIFSAALSLAQEMRANGERGSIVSILCDGGERYLHSYYNDEWVKANGFDIAAPKAEITRLCEEVGAPPWPLPIRRLA